MYKTEDDVVNINTLVKGKLMGGEQENRGNKAPTTADSGVPWSSIKDTVFASSRLRQVYYHISYHPKQTKIPIFVSFF